MGLAPLLLSQAAKTVPSAPPADMFVGENFERFSATAPELDNSPSDAPLIGSPNKPGGYYNGPMTYTRGVKGGLTNTLGGQPLPVADRIHKPRGHFTPANAHVERLQRKLGVGQKGPGSQGIAQTVALATITNNPPQPQPFMTVFRGRG